VIGLIEDSNGAASVGNGTVADGAVAGGAVDVAGATVVVEASVVEEVAVVVEASVVAVLAVVAVVADADVVSVVDASSSADAARSSSDESLVAKGEVVLLGHTAPAAKADATRAMAVWRLLANRRSRACRSCALARVQLDDLLVELVDDSAERKDVEDALAILE